MKKLNAKIEIVGILTFMSRINFALNWDEHEKSIFFFFFYNLWARPWSYKTFFILNSTEHKVSITHKR